MDTAKTLTQVNRDYGYHCYLEESKAKPNSKGAIIKSAIFYSVLIIAVIFAFVWSGDDNSGKRFGPFSYNTVLSDSMTSVYPRGSLVASWAVKPDEPLKAGLADGNDIVFSMKDGKTVVHRIIEIIDNYEDSGQRAFVTQGVNNSRPDDEMVFEGNVIGRVTWHIPYVGSILAFIADNLLWFAAGIVGLFALSSLLRIVFKKEEPQKHI